MLNNWFLQIVKLLKANNVDVSQELEQLEKIRQELIKKKNVIKPDKRFK